MRLVLASFALWLLVAVPAWGAGQSRHFTTSDGVRLHYIEAGQGPRTLVLVPASQRLSLVDLRAGALESIRGGHDDVAQSRHAREC